MRSAISEFVLRLGETPINPFLNFDYNLAGIVEKDLIRTANNTMITHADELWVFGEISDGVMMEVHMAKNHNKPVRLFLPNIDGLTFREIQPDEVRLEDVSPWMWEWMLAGKSLERWHPRLRFKKIYPLVYPAYSKKNFYLQMHISAFCLKNRVIPLNPFMLFRYFLGDTVDRKTIYRGNNNIVRICDEVWVFDEISDGVLAEIKLKRDKGQPVRYYRSVGGYPIEFRKTRPQDMLFEEPELEPYRNLLY